MTDERLAELKRWADTLNEYGWPELVREMINEIERLRNFEALAKETRIFDCADAQALVS